jgi:hypothetical protein
LVSTALQLGGEGDDRTHRQRPEWCLRVRGVARSVVVEGRLPEVQLEVFRLSAGRCQRRSTRWQVQAIQNGADRFGLRDRGQDPHLLSARTAKGFDAEHSLE